MSMGDTLVRHRARVGTSVSPSASRSKKESARRPHGILETQLKNKFNQTPNRQTHIERIGQNKAHNFPA